MSEAERESLRRAIERWNAGDLESGLELATDDVRWYPGDTFPDNDEVYEGKQGIRDFFVSFSEPWEWIRLEPLEQEEIGDQIVVRARFRARSNEGVDVDIELGQRWTYRDGLLCAFHGYSTYAEALEAATAAP
jgi:ketosteroid isomerase-like protein